MKKIISVILSLLIVFSFTIPAFGKDKYFNEEQINYYKNLGLQGTTVNIYNWGEYISDGSDGSMDICKEFERLTGCKVNYTNFETNENMFTKLSGGGVSYDLIIPSDYMIEKLIDEDMLLPLDYENIPNFKYICDDCKNRYYDEDNKYTVCYTTCTTLLIYNKKLVKEKPDSWSVLWDEQYRGKVLMFNNSRDAFAIAQFMLGQSLNTTSEQEWVEAANLLSEQKSKTAPVYVMDEVFNLMESGEYAFATYYGGDYVLMNLNNPDLGFCFPKEGVNAFYDAMCIPTCSKNKKAAEAFINFINEPVVALENSEFIYYRSPNKTVEENKNSSLYNNPAIYPKNIKTQYFKNLPQNIIELQNSLWTQVKSGKLSNESKIKDNKIYRESAIVGIVGLSLIIYKIISNKKKNKEEDLSDLYD